MTNTKDRVSQIEPDYLGIYDYQGLICVIWPEGGYIVWDWNNHKWNHLKEKPNKD